MLKRWVAQILLGHSMENILVIQRILFIWLNAKKTTAKKCYIGETDRELADRFRDNRGYAKNKHLNQPTGFHFNQPVIILEKVKRDDELYRKQREKHIINKFNTFKNGMNLQP